MVDSISNYVKADPNVIKYSNTILQSYESNAGKSQGSPKQVYSGTYGSPQNDGSYNGNYGLLRYPNGTEVIYDNYTLNGKQASSINVLSPDGTGTTTKKDYDGKITMSEVPVKKQANSIKASHSNETKQQNNIFKSFSSLSNEA